MMRGMETTVRVEDRHAHEIAMKTNIAEVVQYLQEVFGQKLTAFIAGASDAKTVGRWARGDNTPRTETEMRLRTAFQVFHLLQSHESAETIRAWFIGVNPHLDDDSPAEALSEDRFPQVIAAARTFIDGG